MYSKKIKKGMLMELTGKTNKDRTEQKIQQLESNKPLYSPKTDPQGMYTGVPRDPYDEPVQDADDL